MSLLEERQQIGSLLDIRKSAQKITLKTKIHRNPQIIGSTVHLFLIGVVGP